MVRRRGSRPLVDGPGWVGWVGWVVVVALVVTGCSAGGTRRDDTERTVPARPAVAPLETLEWAETDGLVSVLLRNTTDRVLRQAEAEVTVLAAGSVATTVEGPCCTVTDLPPGADYAFSFHLPDGVRADDLQVDYRDVVWSGAGSDGSPRITAVPHNIFPNADGTVVVADLTTDGGPVDVAVVQAVVDDARGDLVAIASGTWSCLVPGSPRRVWMQLYTHLPADSTVRTVTAYARPTERPAGDANLRTTCDPDQVGSTGR